MNTTQMLVADLMTIDPMVIGVHASIEDAARVLNANAISGLPVVDAGGSLVGVISQTDLLRVSHTPVGRVIRAQATGLRVGELMTSPAVVVSMTASLVEAARVMRDARIHRVVAIDEDGRPIGVLAALDFVALVADA
jgi:CBS domain-containing protein